MDTRSPAAKDALRAAYRDHLARLLADYARVLEEEGLDAVILHAGTPRLRSEFDDAYWPLRVVPHFQHWLPLQTPDALVVVRGGARPRLVWPKIDNFWEQPAPPPGDHWQDQFDLKQPTELGRIKAELPAPGPKVAFIGEDARRAAEWGFSLSVGSLVKRLDQLRVRKSEYEKICLAEANRIAARGHQAVRSAFVAGDRSELDLHLLYLESTRQDDPETPYKNILALGEHAATLHHISYDRTARAAESLLIDAGATYLGYASDVTRTYVRPGGAAASLFQELVARVERMQQRLCGEVAIGLPYERLHDRAHEEVGAILSELGVARGSAEEAVKTGVTRAFFPHGLGHSLGLQTHDVGCAEVKPRSDNPFLRNTTVIEETQVFTIEPGIYFIDALLGPLRLGPQRQTVDWKQVDALRPFGGVRIEDDVAVEARGPRNFTREAMG
jgi:Xaa-Pro dipeptidase